MFTSMSLHFSFSLVYVLAVGNSD